MKLAFEAEHRRAVFLRVVLPDGTGYRIGARSSLYRRWCSAAQSAEASLSVGRRHTPFRATDQSRSAKRLRRSYEPLVLHPKFLVGHAATPFVWCSF